MCHEISGREHEKVVVKSLPRCQDLDIWRSGTVHAVRVASGDPGVKGMARMAESCTGPFEQKKSVGVIRRVSFAARRAQESWHD